MNRPEFIRTLSTQYPHLAQALENGTAEMIDGWTPFIIATLGVTQRSWNKMTIGDLPGYVWVRNRLPFGTLKVTMEERNEVRELVPGQETWFITVHDLRVINLSRQSPP